MKVTSLEFQNNVEHFQHATQSSPVIVTRDARPHTVLMSAALFEIVVKGRVARRVEDLDEETLNAIADASVPAEFAELDDLIKDWNP